MFALEGLQGRTRSAARNTGRQAIGACGGHFVERIVCASRLMWMWP
jgi:hypothetical protein